MIVRSFLLFFSSVLLIQSQQGHASTKPEQIYASISHFMASYHDKLLTKYGASVRIEHEISNIDPRLSMPECAQALTVNLKSHASIGRINLKISCLKGSPWSIYVPARIRLFRKVAVTTMPLARGVRLSASALQLREADVSKLRGNYYTSLDNILGMQTKRSLLPDTPVTASQIEPPVLIKKGESILITANSGSLVVKTPATALMDGRIGQQIRVRNRQSKRIVEAKVVAPGQVVVPM